MAEIKFKFDNPFDQMRDPVNFQLFERFIGRIDWEKMSKQFTESCKAEVTFLLQEKTPDLLVNFTQTYKDVTRLYQEIEDKIRNFEKQIQSLEKKVKKAADSSSLYEDVYKLRDQMKELSKGLDKIKKAFS